MTIYYKTTNKNKLYNSTDNIPKNIDYIEYVEFEIKDHTFKLHHPNFLIDDICPFDELLPKFFEFIETIKNQTLCELYNQLLETNHLDLRSWYKFDNDFFTLFEIKPYEAVKATYLGNIKSLNDNYIRYNAYDNFETTNELDYKTEANEILEQYIEENFYKLLND